ncbi:MAG: hypothetical protein EHM64_00115 [Ignavibacteriae bacterium]|nr:MAG: hypothetical protein EHM64_00115 [Ignavibacteriota bacterium]
MPDSTLNNLTAATTGLGGLFYGTQAGIDKKFTSTAAGAALLEAANAAAQRTAMGVPSTTDLDAKLNLAGGALTGAISMPLAASETLANARINGICFGTSAATSTNTISSYNNSFHFYTGSRLSMLNTSVELGLHPDIKIGWAAHSGANVGKDLYVGRASAAVLQLGENNLTTATNQTIKAHNVTVGTGANLILSGGTGTIANGVVIISRLPTSNPGPGILWNNDGTPAIGT